MLWHIRGRRTLSAGAVAALLLGATSVRADTLGVPYPYPTIQEAIDAAAMEGDEIRVEAGWYQEWIDFHGKAIRLYSVDGPGSTYIDPNSYDHRPVVSCVNGEGADTRLEGFTIMGGGGQWLDAPRPGYYGGGMLNLDSSPTVTNCIFESSDADYGAGMANVNASPTVTDCTFRYLHYYGASGTGMCNVNGNPSIVGCTFTYNGSSGWVTSTAAMLNLDRSAPQVTDCTFSYNDGYEGSAMRNDASSPTVTNCTFSNNYGSAMYNRTGSNPTVTDCTFHGNETYEDGAGMYNWASSPIVTNCTFSENVAEDHGGGMYNGGGSNPTVTGCMFDQNDVYQAWGGDGEHGGGMCNVGSSPTVVSCTFHWNMAEKDGGGMANLDGSHPTVRQCTFSGNAAYDNGGGMANRGGSNPSVISCSFSNNLSEWGDGGGAIYNNASHPRIVFCSFHDDFTEAHGGAIRNVASSPDVTGCLFRGHHAWNQGGAFYSTDGSAPMFTSCTIINCDPWPGEHTTIEGSGTFINCVIWNNSEVPIIGDVTVQYSVVEGGYPGVGNLDANPLCDGAGRLGADSPCIDAGVNTAVPVDVLDVDDDGDTTERLPLDRDGNPRFADDAGQSDQGCGEPAVVDIGAYEHVGVPVHPVLVGDCDGDGGVDFRDILLVIAAWGECPDACCLEDMDFDQHVDINDLALVVSNWN